MKTISVVKADLCLNRNTPISLGRHQMIKTQAVEEQWNYQKYRILKLTTEEKTADENQWHNEFDALHASKSLLAIVVISNSLLAAESEGDDDDIAIATQAFPNSSGTPEFVANAIAQVIDEITEGDAAAFVKPRTTV